ncbi:hypothetical protein [Shewanella halifaxensis]|uniref:hypothetical protein n=1 Tax=Shewanella halifaxensis TaxID=271098 RepID=UPI000D5932D8|nr:hypothetical protein [Shewanella halifaxensis]
MKIPMILMLFLAIECAAHEDTILVLEGSTLRGLPSMYEPAFYDQATLTLGVGSTVITFPRCTLEYFDFMGNESLLITASWYHSPELLPPYLGFGRKGHMMSAMLFNLDSLELIEDEYIGLPSVEAEKCLSGIVRRSVHDT